MKLPGTEFLRERRAVKEFETQDRSFRDLVFYSEDAGDWPHLGPVIQALLRDHDRKISYLTSDAADPGLRLEDERFRAFDIGSGTARTVLFARMNSRHFVMTLPDLDNLWLKRSVHPVHYIYVFHSMNSTHTSYRTGAFDAFDTILCVGPYHVDEIRRTEEVYGLRPKELVEHGSVKLDTVLAELADASRVEPKPEAEVLVAPTWGDSSMIEGPAGREVISILLGAGYRIVLRLHPMTVRRLPKLVGELRRVFGGDPRFVLEDDMNATASWLRSDIMISDWSGAAIEYAFALLKPVVYIDTPPKIMNAEWERIGMPSFEDQVRRDIGHVLEPARVAELPTVIAEAVDGAAAAHERAREARSRWVFNLGSAANAAADYLVGLGTK